MNKTKPLSKSEETHQRIFTAASQLFAEKGYAETTTRAIAEAAGINEVTLFRHFGSKENLVKTIMEQHGGAAIASDLQARLSGDYEKDLALIGNAIMKVMTERSDAMRMAICEAGNFPELQQVVAENPRQLRHMLARYFKDQMSKGILTQGHPEVLAQAFLGMFFSYVVLKGFLLDDLQPQVSREEIVETFVELFVKGTLNQQG